jgi:hypothetical protein
MAAKGVLTLLALLDHAIQMQEKSRISAKFMGKVWNIWVHPWLHQDKNNNIDLWKSIQLAEVCHVQSEYYNSRLIKDRIEDMSRVRPFC